jgi:hypothetical protein
VIEAISFVIPPMATITTWMPKESSQMMASCAECVIVLEKALVAWATDDTAIAAHMLHGQWSSLSLGKIGDRKLVFFGGGDGLCYAFETLSAVPDKPVKLKTVWSFDCNPPEYKACGDMDWVTHYCMGDKRWGNNNNDGTLGTSKISALPFCSATESTWLGRDPEHGRGRGVHCIDATKTGTSSQTGKI